MEALIDDLKLTYQLENGLLPVNRERQNMVRFLKELAIDILNTPEYEDRVIGFDSTEDAIFYSFDSKLLTRAFRNLIINALVHGGETAKVTLRVSCIDGALLIQAADNGKGIVRRRPNTSLTATTAAPAQERSRKGLAWAWQ